jgi:Pyruvate-formate lyase-activating enzyme
MRVSLNSARAGLYERYYRPSGYSFDDVRASIREGRSRGLWVSLNLLVFPGVTDTEEELDALARLVGENGVSMRKFARTFYLLLCTPLLLALWPVLPLATGGSFAAGQEVQMHQTYPMVWGAGGMTPCRGSLTALCESVYFFLFVSNKIDFSLWLQAVAQGALAQRFEVHAAVQNFAPQLTQAAIHILRDVFAGSCLEGLHIGNAHAAVLQVAHKYFLARKMAGRG